MILLARHGETDDNVPPLRFQGQRDTPLNDNGRAQARELAEQVIGDLAHGKVLAFAHLHDTFAGAFAGVAFGNVR